MTNKIYITQPCLGDTLYCLKIAFKLIEHGYEVYWQVDNKYNWISSYIINNNLHFHRPELEYLKLDLSHSIEDDHPYDLMTCKYKMIGKTLPQLPEALHNIDFSDWQKYIKINRNKDKENELYYNYFGLKDSSRYILANQNYGQGQIREGILENIRQVSDLPIIWNQFVGGFTLFDWIKVIENAVQIHTVDTSIQYIIESIPIKAEKLFLYPRHPEHTQKALIDVLKLNWSFVK